MKRTSWPEQDKDKQEIQIHVYTFITLYVGGLAPSVSDVAVANYWSFLSWTFCNDTSPLFSILPLILLSFYRSTQNTPCTSRAGTRHASSNAFLTIKFHTLCYHPVLCIPWWIPCYFSHDPSYKLWLGARHSELDIANRTSSLGLRQTNILLPQCGV